MSPSKKSPYVATSDRLADVIAAIQAMGVYKFHMRTFDHWAQAISGDTSKGSHWRTVFEEHPEFFRLDTERKRASLVWRRQFPRLFDVDSERQLSKEEFASLSPEGRKRVSRARLSPSDIKALVEAAINLHSRAVEIQREGKRSNKDNTQHRVDCFSIHPNFLICRTAFFRS